jgi:hypothetical protein
MRVYQIAKEAGVTSRDVRDYLEMIGMPVKTASANLKDEIMVSALITRLVATRDDFARAYVKPPF